MTTAARMKELVETLTQASRAYYQEDREIMDDRRYDQLYRELEDLERQTGITLAGSPTVTVGYEALEELPKEAHEFPMLSLDKTKDIETLRSFIGTHRTLLSWKLDGLTIVLTYENGSLSKAVTRGNGLVGEVITNNARVFANLPLKIPYTGRLVLRGEAVISYRDFAKINEQIGDADARYKNPRNLCSGSVRQLNNEITAKRNVHFYAFALVSAPDIGFEDSHEKEMDFLTDQGFQIVEYRVVTGDTLDAAMEYFSAQITEHDIPSDGLVALYDSISYGDSLGSTSKFPRNSFAFKWADEIRETTLEEIEWSPSRTGLINPVAIFSPVELEGTTVSRASVHNISILEELELGIGDTIQVYKANMIIPQIAENLTRSRNLTIPRVCPACKGETQIAQDTDVRVLRCPNPDCPAKKIKAFTLFVSRDALNIEGLSEATLEKFIGRGFLQDFSDLFALGQYKDEIIDMDGFGEKSYENLMENLKKARTTTLPRVLYSLGIPGIGLANARLICRHFDQDMEQIMGADEEEVSSIDGIGPVLAQNLTAYFSRPENQKLWERLRQQLNIEAEKGPADNTLERKTFVITGNLEHFANRKELKELIESKGGKVTGTVTGKTDCLINNNTASNSSKNKKARELGIPVISEEEFISSYAPEAAESR